MKLFVSLAVLAVLVTLVQCEMKHARYFPEGTSSLPLPSKWTKTGVSVPGDAELRLHIALTNQRLGEMEAKFWAVSDPTNADYGNHLSLDEIAGRFGAKEETIEAVSQWLSDNGVTDFDLLRSRDWIVANVSITSVQNMFHVEFSTYKYQASNAYTPGTLEAYSLPVELTDHIDLVSGITDLPDFGKRKVHRGLDKMRADGMVGPAAITPAVIRAAYNVPANLTGSANGNIQACSEFQGQYYSPKDLVTFFDNFVNNSDAHNVTKLVGMNQGDEPSGEGSLDIQYLMGVAPEVETYFYSMPAFKFWEDLTIWQGWLNNATTVPNVMSVSYGTQGQWPTAKYQARSDSEYQKLGLRGISVIFASGDNGAGCLVPGSASKCVLAPSYPATSVYVTSVGATRFISGNSGQEAAVSYYKSGGGFSDFDAAPSYQAAAVKSYLTSGVNLPPATSFNATGRGTPDVAALGAIHFLIVQGGAVSAIGGTSAAAPTFSAIVSLLNDIRINANSPTLGFLNTWLYQTAAANPTAFTDVVIGNNVVGCCEGGLSGFLCQPGWDPVTGLGTPNFEILKTLV
eukprot:TRINITY_DN2168_c0_g1_i1.p1 TRINITY_DN2168_c0_g1~~TRINITY_DN2168_c0_g1_i1.p1  ORF type:complete len:570 (-),score=120.49 TRINITY_DN2168_c0_g1_i1:112-1821(-)